MIKNSKWYRLIHRDKSLAWVCIRGFLLYLLVMALLYQGITVFSDFMLDAALPDINDILKYEKRIAADQYDKIPRNAYRNCSLFVFDEEGQVIFPQEEEKTGQTEVKPEQAEEVKQGQAGVKQGQAEDKPGKSSADSQQAEGKTVHQEEKPAEIISADELAFIPDASEDSSYEVFQDQDGNGWWLFKVKDVNGDMDETIGYCRVEEDGQIEEGNLFSDQMVITRQEMRMLLGISSSDKNIVKTSVTNQEGESRTIVFIYPMASEELLNTVWSKSYYLMMMYLVAGFVGLFVLAALLTVKIKKSIQPLNEIMNQYRMNGTCEEPGKVFLEYQGIVDNFAELTKSIQISEQRRIDTEKEKNRMIMDLSHDLKTPLTVIQGYAQALDSGKVPEADRRKYLGVLRKKSDVSVQMINNLMQYATMEHPDYEVHKERKDICEVIRTFLIERYDEIETQGMQLELAIPDEPVYYEVDVRIFGNLFDNLINNTIKYNQAGTTIFISLEAEKKQLVIEYADDGIGIPPEIKDSVFTPFVIGNQARTSVKGTGIGMSIVKRAVELHGGRITVEDNGGSRFSVIFRMVLPIEGN